MGAQLVYGSVATRRSIGLFHPWIVAAVSFGIGTVASGLASLGLSLLGYADVPALTAPDLAAMTHGGALPDDVLFVFGVTQGLGVLVQAAWLLNRARHPLLAPVLSAVVAWGMAAILAPFALPATPVLLAVPICQVLAMCMLIGRGPAYRG